MIIIMIITGRTDIIVASMLKYKAEVKNSAAVQVAAMRALAAATLRRPMNCRVIVLHGAHSLFLSLSECLSLFLSLSPPLLSHSLYSLQVVTLRSSRGLPCFPRLLVLVAYL